MLNYDKKTCTGCGLCSEICVQKCIKMRVNSDGFLYPCIENEELCVNCGLCNKKCPLNNSKFNDYVKKVYAVQHKDKDTLKKCASGGAFTSLVNYIIDLGGSVCGVAEIDGKVKFIVTNKKEELEYICGSKYYQCSISEEIYKEIRERCKKEKVLFSGTPCQVSAIKNFLDNKLKTNLITLEILCQGVPSEKVVRKFYEIKEKKNSSKIIKHFFRSKDYYVGRNYLNKYVYDNGKIEYEIGGDDPLSLSFQRQIFLRESCYNCKFSKEERVADFTAGDLWDYNLKNRNINFEDGVSVLIANNEYSNSIINSCHYFYKEEIDEKLSLNDNLPFHKPVKRPLSRNISFILLNNNINGILITKICCWKYYIKRTLKKVRGSK